MLRVDKTAQKVKAFALKPANLSLIPETHVVKERAESHKFSSGLHTLTMIFTTTPTYVCMYEYIYNT